MVTLLRALFPRGCAGSHRIRRGLALYANLAIAAKGLQAATAGQSASAISQHCNEDPVRVVAVSVRARKGGDLGSLSLDAVLVAIQSAVNNGIEINEVITK